VNADWKKVFAVTRHTESRNRDHDPKTGKILRSHAGAMGRMQVMPATARDPGFGIKPWDGKDLNDLARVGEQLLQALARKYNGDMSKAWAAYNWGQGRVDNLVRKHGDNWFQGNMPDETRNYVRQNMGMLGRDLPASGTKRTPSLEDPGYWRTVFNRTQPERATDLESADRWRNLFGAQQRSPEPPEQRPAPASPAPSNLSDKSYWQNLFGSTTRTTPGL
jgi:hypothetical protein